MEMTDDRWRSTNEYVRDVFGDPDEFLASLPGRAEDAGLPRWEISPEVGRLLSILVSATRARLVLEVGTLAGYSAIWMARSLASDGRLITIEYDDAHADFAEQAFAETGLSDRIEVVRGAALDVLGPVGERVGAESVDLVFIDASKDEYLDYVRLTSDLIAPGGFLVIDNCLGTGSTWITDLDDPSMQVVDAANRAVEDDDRFEATALTVRAGVLVARRRTSG